MSRPAAGRLPRVALPGALALLAAASAARALDLGHRLPRHLGHAAPHAPWLALASAGWLALGCLAAHLARRALRGGVVLPRRAARSTRLLAYGLAAASLPAMAWGGVKPDLVYEAGVALVAALAAAALVFPEPARALPARAVAALDLAAGNALLAVLGLEAALALHARVDTSVLYLRHADPASVRLARMRLAPGSLHLGDRVNADGYHDEPFREARTPGTARLAFIGDSFGTTVVPRARNVAGLLEQGLGRWTGQPHEVCNFSIPGVGPPEYLEVLRHEVPRFRPDRAVLAFFVGNDVVRDYGPGGACRLYHPEAWYLHAVLRKLALMARPEGRGTQGRVPAPDEPTYSEEEFLAIERDRLRVCRDPPDDEQAGRWDHTLGLLGDLVREAGPGLVVLLIPDEFQVDDALWGHVVEAAPGGPQAYDRGRPQRVIGEYLRRLGAAVADPLDALREAARGAPVYQPRDTHWNARGHQVAAEVLLAALAAMAGE
ncbi:MAG: hypothetical protein HY722_05385 [Planctomycetes bacterium]|nr:hypothetical protein [Planctomycetota bacterium]